MKDLKSQLQAAGFTASSKTEVQKGFALDEGFHNPYNFVPALPRDESKTDFDDAVPKGHATYLQSHWSGTIAVNLSVKTPLLIHDASAAQVEDNGHKIIPMRLDPHGFPYLAPTSVKGMLRSIYEAITNSRLSVFTGHNDRLAYRNLPSPSVRQEKPTWTPVRVIEKNGDLYFKLLKYESLKNFGHTIRLPYYHRRRTDRLSAVEPLSYQGKNQQPQHGDRVWVVHNSKGIAQEIRYGEKPKDGANWLEGWVYVTGQNMNNKAYERIFVEGQQESEILMQPAHKKMWLELITNYKLANKRSLNKRVRDNIPLQEYCGGKPGEMAFSRHIWAEGSEILQPGTLCYVLAESKDKITTITAMAPVTISRQLYDVSPSSLLPPLSLQPATSLEKLSPADRVFGWANQDGHGAYRGQLRISTVQCNAESPERAIERLQEPVPLSILSTPKPEQARFYIAQDQQGNPLSPQVNKADGYAQGQSIRGRKVYPHHQQGLNGREWSRTSQEKDDQNCSINSWVKQGVSFSLTIDVMNLSDIELGALLWILDLNAIQKTETYYHRLGAGKPLGFGSVALSVDWGKTVLCKGEDWRTFYQNLGSQLTGRLEARDCIAQYQTAFIQVYGISKKAKQPVKFENIPLIAAFLQTAKGFDDKLPIHYPRISRNKARIENKRSQDNPIFDWFVDNESANQKEPGKHLALPKLWEETGLPYRAKGIN
jgi:CRISPR-associated protein (TIGR03986 family)